MIQPPTDSIYKFLTVCGLILFALSLAFIYRNLNAYEKRVAEVYGEGEVVKYRHDALLERVDQFGKEIERAVAANAKLGLPIPMDSLKHEREQLTSDAQLNCEQIVEQSSKVRELHTYEGLLNWYFRIAGIGAFVGLVLTGFGFSLWYKRDQRYQDAARRSNNGGKG